MVVGVGIEEVVGNVLEDRVQELARHLRAVGGRIGHAGGVEQILAGDVVAGQEAWPPTEAGAERDVGLALVDQGMTGLGAEMRDVDAGDGIVSQDADDLARGIEELVELNAYHAANSNFYVITPLKTPLHASKDSTVEETTRLLNEWAASQDRVEILDANRLLVKPDGRPNPAYYRADGVNLNEHGYRRLSVLLQTELDKHSPPG